MNIQPTGEPAPTPTPDLSNRLASLTPAQRKLLEMRLKQKGGAAAATAPGDISPRPDPALVPLSVAQERLWVFQQLEPGNFAYNRVSATRLIGALDTGALAHSLSAVARRHEALRTTVALQDGQPVARIEADQPVELPLTDLCALAAEDRLARAIELAAEYAQQPFDLSRAPLLRAQLLRLAEGDHVLLLNVHHIASDGFSDGVFWREMTALYAAFVRHEPAPLPDLRLQYADFAYWQRQALKSGALAQQLAYWKHQVANGATRLQLPTDRPRPVQPTFRGSTLTFVVPQDVHLALRSMSRSEGATLYMTLLTAFKALLHHYSGQNDIIVGTPIAGRNQVQVESLIGFFNNTLALRTDLSGDPTFRTLLKRVRETALGAYANQDVPVEKLFQVMFILQNTPPAQVNLPGITAQPLAVPSRAARFDLTLSMEEAHEGLVGSLEYNTDLFDAETARRMIGHFQTLLIGIVADPDQCLSDFAQNTLPAADAQPAPGASTFVAPRTPLESQLARIWEEVLDRRPIGVEDSFFDLGGHSLLVVNLFVQIEKVLGRRLPMTMLFEAPTIAHFAGLLEQKGWSPSWSSLVALQPGGSKPPFYCVHEWDGNAFYYKDLATQLGNDQPFYGLQAAALDGNSEPRETIEEIAADYLQEIRAFQPTGPYYLGGSSLGGLVAYEMAQQLLAQGQEVGRLVLFDTYSPAHRKLISLSAHQRAARHLERLGELSAWGRLAYLTERVRSRLDIRWWMQNVQTKLRKQAAHRAVRMYKQTGRAFTPELHNTFVADALVAAQARYVPKPYPGRITFFQAAEHHDRYYQDALMTADSLVAAGFVSRADAEAVLAEVYPLSWGGLALGGLEVHTAPGTHGYMVRPAYAEGTAQLLRSCLGASFALHQHKNKDKDTVRREREALSADTRHTRPVREPKA